MGIPGSSGALPGDDLADWLAKNLGVRLLNRRPVGGGCIHSAWCLSVLPSGGPAPRPEPFSGGLLFAKTNTLEALPLLEAEAEGLEALARAAAGTDLCVPAPLAVGVAGNQAVLVLPWLELAGGSNSAAAGGAWGRLGAALATLHRSSLEHPCISGDRPGSFGWPRDNVIGSGPQQNGWLAGGAFSPSGGWRPRLSGWSAGSVPCRVRRPCWSGCRTGSMATAPIPALFMAISGAATPPSTAPVRE